MMPPAFVVSIESETVQTGFTVGTIAENSSESVC